MKIEPMKLSQYRETYGEPRAKGGRGLTEEDMALWQQIKSLPMVEVLIARPDKHDGELGKFRARMYQRFRSMADKTNANFKLLFCLNKEEKHVVIMKMAKAQK